MSIPSVLAQSFILLKRVILKNRPFYVHYGITHRCNLRCKMCSVYQRDPSRELSLKEISLLFDFLKSQGCVYVSIGGGEPVVREDLPLICGMLIKKGLRVRVLTNGTLLRADILRELFRCGVREVSVSLHSLDRTTVDAICGVPGAFDKVVENIELIRKVFHRSKCLLLLNTVVSALNIDDLPCLYEFASSRGYYISFIPIEGCGDGNKSCFIGNIDAIDRSYDYLIASKRQKNRIFNSSRFLEHSRRYLKTGEKRFQCDAGRLYLSVGPEGGISMCHRFEPVMYVNNLIEGYLMAKDFRRKCGEIAIDCPGCVRPCWAEISFLAHDQNSFFEMLRLHFGARR